MSSSPIVVRVRGLPRTDRSTAEATVRRAVDESSAGEKVDYKVSIIAACDRANELVALIDFATGLPDFLSSIKANPLGSHEVTVDDEDLSFDRHFIGFTQLYDVEDERDIQADIIAICGLDGHAYGSWQGRGKNRRMWLRHFLSRDLPLCRTVTYGYSAKLSSRGFATTEDYSNDLLEDLKRLRKGETQARPVIFVAHSFGGLILARSLIEAMQVSESDSPTLVSLYQATYGILNFAVPYRGIDVEDMSRILGEENHPRAELLSYIKVNSSQLLSQVEQFKDVLKDRKIVSFFEVEQSQRLVRAEKGEWIRSGEYFTSVEKENAVLGLPRHIETSVPLHCDHSGMVKYDNRSDNNYSRALFYLQEFVTLAPHVVSRRFQLKMSDSQFLPTQPMLAEMRKAADALYRQGMYSDAVGRLLPVLVGCKRTLGNEHFDTLKVLYLLGKAYNKQGRYLEAEEMLSQAYVGYEKTLGPEHDLTIHTMCSLGVSYVRLNKLSEAEGMYMRSLVGLKKIRRPSDPYMLKLIYNLGDVCKRQGKYSKSMEYYWRVFVRRKEMLGEEHVMTKRTKAAYDCASAKHLAERRRS